MELFEYISYYCKLLDFFILSMSGEEVLVKNDVFQETVLNHLANLHHDTNFSDVTLVCKDGYQVKAHRVILIASSVFFRELLEDNVEGHPLICLLDVDIKDVRRIVTYCYTGEVGLVNGELSLFLDIADQLKIEGLQNNKTAKYKSNKKDKSFENNKSTQKRNTSLGNIDPLKVRKVSSINKTEMSSDRETGELEPEFEILTNVGISNTGVSKQESETFTYVKIEGNVENETMNKKCIADNNEKDKSKKLKVKDQICNLCDFQSTRKEKWMIHNQKCPPSVKQENVQSHSSVNVQYKIKSKTVKIKDQMCNLCGFHTRRKSRWINHGQKCPPRTWPCNLCGTEMRKEALLKKHMWLEHVKDRCGEEGCNYTSPFTSELTFHIKKEHGGAPICDICGDEYASDGGLKKHIDRIHDGRRLACDSCQYQAITKNHLTSHKKTKHREQEQLMKSAMVAV